jgi:hypothetical protein
VIEDDQIRLARDDEFDIGIETVPYARNIEGLRGVLTPSCTADYSVRRTEGEQQFGDGWRKGNDTSGRSIERYGSTSIVDVYPGALRSTACQQDRGGQQRYSRTEKHKRSPFPRRKDGERTLLQYSEFAWPLSPPRGITWLGEHAASPGFEQLARLPGFPVAP